MSDCPPEGSPRSPEAFYPQESGDPGLAPGSGQGWIGRLRVNELRKRTVADLLSLHAEVIEELRQRGVLRSANNPTGDLAEYLFCQAFGWTQETNSAKGFDATDDGGVRFQIKGRRLHRRNKSRQLSAIRDLDGFDTLAAVLLDDDYRVVRAALVPAPVVRERSTYVEHTNSHKFILRDDVWEDSRVIDVTGPLRGAE